MGGKDKKGGEQGAGTGPKWSRLRPPASSPAPLSPERNNSGLWVSRAARPASPARTSFSGFFKFKEEAGRAWEQGFGSGTLGWACRWDGLPRGAATSSSQVRSFIPTRAPSADNPRTRPPKEASPLFLTWSVLCFCQIPTIAPVPSTTPHPPPNCLPRTVGGQGCVSRP